MEGIMNAKVAKVLNGFIQLNDQEKQELIKTVQEYFKYPNSTEQEVRKFLTESNAITFGPAPSSCPCCGK
jgi:hypothetical protein